jgi:hypothetical protein
MDEQSPLAAIPGDGVQADMAPGVAADVARPVQHAFSLICPG